MLNKDKILIISLDYPPVGGGQGIFVENITNEFNKNNYNVTVLTTKSLERKKNKFKIKEINYSGQNPIIFIFWSYFYYLFKLRKENYSIIHGNSINHLLFLLFKQRGIKYITTVHNTYLQRLESKKESIFYNIIYPLFIKLEKFIFKRSDAIIAVSRNTRNYINKLTKNENVFIIENGVDTNKYKLVEKNNDIFRFIYVGRLEVRKRVLETVKIFEIFLEQYKGNKKIEFLIVGNGSLYNKIKEYIEENNLRQVKLIGFSSNVKKYYDNSNCLLLLSKGEGLPLALLEAISSGLSTVITKDASGLADIVQTGINGYIVEDQLNTEEIVSKMNNVISNYEVFSLKSELIAKNYDWSIIINKYLKIYNI